MLVFVPLCLCGDRPKALIIIITWQQVLSSDLFQIVHLLLVSIDRLIPSVAIVIAFINAREIPTNSEITTAGQAWQRMRIMLAHIQ